jgi:hypothetical protein
MACPCEEARPESSVAPLRVCASWILGMEVFLQRLPAGIVLVLAGSGVHCELCGAADEAGFEHEGESAVEFDGL